MSTERGQVPLAPPLLMGLLLSMEQVGYRLDRQVDRYCLPKTW